MTGYAAIIGLSGAGKSYGIEKYIESLTDSNERDSLRRRLYPSSEETSTRQIEFFKITDKDINVSVCDTMGDQRNPKEEYELFAFITLGGKLKPLILTIDGTRIDESIEYLKNFEKTFLEENLGYSAGKNFSFKDTDIVVKVTKSNVDGSSIELEEVEMGIYDSLERIIEYSKEIDAIGLVVGDSGERGINPEYAVINFKEEKEPVITEESMIGAKIIGLKYLNKEPTIPINQAIKNLLAL